MSVKFNFQSLDERFEADWPVAIQVPQDGGTTQEQTMNVRFRLLNDEELEQTAKSADPSKEGMRLAFVGFGKGEDEAWSEELRERLLSVGYVRLGINKAYGQFSLGIAAKN